MSVVAMPQPRPSWIRPDAPPFDAGPRLLAGPPLGGNGEAWADHIARLGRRPRGGPWLIDTVAASGLRGRGGAWFPTARKWRGVADAADRRESVVVVNASEGEPLSAKDVTLVSHRPHLVIDGALLAAESIGATEVIVYLSRASRPATRALRHALRERSRAGVRDLPVHLVHTAHRYVSGESSAVVRRASGGVAKPRFAPPHPSDNGVDGRPTLVQNAETIAHIALIARRGEDWYRACGTVDAPGTTLLTIGGTVRLPGVYEVEVGTPLVEALALAGGTLGPPRGVLIGGYFGAWMNAATLPQVLLRPSDDVPLGCGVVGVLAPDACPLREAASIVTYLAAESAGQCGVCVFGLRAIAETMTHLAAGNADRGDLARLGRWTTMVRGRGGCRHPDGAVNHVVSAIDAFGDDLGRHLAGDPCAAHRRLSLPPPQRHRGWR